YSDYHSYRSFFSQRSPDHPALHSFPTRRSSDLPLHRLGVAAKGFQRTPGDSRLLRPRQRGQLFHNFRRAHGDNVSELRRRRKRRSEEHTSELQSRFDLVCRLLLEKKNINNRTEL